MQLHFFGKLQFWSKNPGFYDLPSSYPRYIFIDSVGLVYLYFFNKDVG